MANKAQFIQKLSAVSGLSIADATAAVNALPEAAGAWLREYGTNGSGSYTGTVEGGLSFSMQRTPTPTPAWIVQVTLTPDGLTDFGDGSDRFGLPVQNL